MSNKTIFPPFPKVFADHRHIGRETDAGGFLLAGDVIVTEKIDGSQIGFGVLDGELRFRSKGMEMPGEPEKIFQPTVDHLRARADFMEPGWVYYGEAMRGPRHNTLKYDRAPKNHLALYGALRPDGSMVDRETLCQAADSLDVDAVPVLLESGRYALSDLRELLDRTSYLGGVKVEGIVAHRAERWYWSAIDREYPLLAVKIVRDDFKETHKKEWKKSTPSGRYDELKQACRSEARWEKAVQHLRDSGLLENIPRDIGKLIVEAKRDFVEEEKETLKEELWKIFGDEMVRTSIRGLPEWYKDRLDRIE